MFYDFIMLFKSYIYVFCDMFYRSILHNCCLKCLDYNIKFGYKSNRKSLQPENEVTGFTVTKFF